MMKYNVTVKAGTSQEKVVQSDTEITVWTRAKAHDGAANAAIIQLLAKYFHVSKSSVRIIRGATSRHKLIEIL